MNVQVAPADRAVALQARLVAARARRDHLASCETTNGASYLAGAVCCAVLRLRLVLLDRRRSAA